MDFLEKLPDTYLPVRVHGAGNYIELGFLDRKRKELFLFTEDGVFEYDENEIKELFRLHDPVSGMEYDKVL